MIEVEVVENWRIPSAADILALYPGTRRQLEALGEKRARGEISAEEEHEAQAQILATKIAPKLVTPRMEPAGPAENKNEERSGGRRRRVSARPTRRTLA